MIGFLEGKPREDGKYVLLVKWHEACNIWEDAYSLWDVYMINGSLYDFDDGMPVNDGIDFDILGWRAKAE